MRYALKISLAAFTALLVTSCETADNQKKLLLPVLGEKKATGADTTYHTISSFTLVNQDAETVTQDAIAGKIVVANFFFATCQSICPEMSSNLVTVQEKFIGDDSLLILSHSVNPMHDTVEVLKAYAGRYGVKSGKWHLLTGDKKVIYDLARNSYLVNAVEDDGTPEGFLHSELFILIDPEGRLRAMYDGTDPAELNRLQQDIATLKKEIAANKK